MNKISIQSSYIRELMGLKTIQLPTFSDEKGMLSVLDDAAPFPIARVFWISGADGQTRGGHRHKKTRQLLISVSGEVTIYLNNGVQENTVLLSQSNQGLLVEPEDWHTMTFGPKSILLVLASHPYDKDDYIYVSHG